MNIVGMPKPPVKMVSFLDPSDYLFGLPHETSALGSEQGGIYLRGFISVRIQHWPSEKIEAMDRYFVELQERSSRTPLTSSLIALHVCENFRSGKDDGEVFACIPRRLELLPTFSSVVRG